MARNKVSSKYNTHLWTEFAKNPKDLKNIAVRLKKARLEVWWALVVDRDGGSMFSSADDTVETLFKSKELAEAATNSSDRYRGGWGSRGKAYPVLVLTTDGKQGLIVPPRFYKLAVKSEIEKEIAAKAEKK